jgi:hypothetical protein
VIPRDTGQGGVETGASGVDGLQRGAVIWEVTEGHGQFARATGLITSNFTVGSKREVMDNHYVRQFLRA